MPGVVRRDVDHGRVVRKIKTLRKGARSPSLPSPGFVQYDGGGYPFETGSNERILRTIRFEPSPSTNAARRCSTLLQITPSPVSNRTRT